MRRLFALSLYFFAATAVAGDPVNYGDRIKLTPDGDAHLIEKAPVEHPELPEMFPHGVPNFSYQPTIVSAQSGDAADPATWGGAVPNADDRVVILPGHFVKVGEGSYVASSALAVWGKFKLEGGRWDTINFQTVDYDGKRGFFDVEGGWGKLVFRDVDASDPHKWGTGGIIQGDMAGTARNAREPFVFATGEIPAGTTRIEVTHIPENWEVGGVVGLPRMSQSAIPENERCVIAGFDGNAIILQEPTKYLHEIVYDYDKPWDWKNSEKRVVELPVLVNLSADLEITSENPQGNRGHFVVTGHGWASVEGVLFSHMGRTPATGFTVPGTTESDDAVIARYLMHLHHQHGEPCYFGRCVFDIGDETPYLLRWTFSVHMTNAAEVAYCNFWGGVGESHLATEDGPEYGNRLYHNIMVGGGAGVWAYGPQNYIDFNTVYGCQGTGVDSTGNGFHIGYRNDGNGRKDPKSITFPVNPNDPHGEQITIAYSDAVPLSFKGNKSISCGAGLRAWMQGTGPNLFVIDDFTALHCTALSVYYEHNVTYNNLTGYGDPRWATKIRTTRYPNGADSLSTGLVLGTRLTKSATFNNLKLRGYWRGIWGRQSGGESVVRINGGEIASVDMDLHKQAWGAAKLYFSGVKMLNPSTRKIAMDLGGLYNHLPDIVVVDGERIYYSQQANPNFVWRDIKGTPVGGKTLAETWAMEPPFYLCGAKPPCEATRPGIAGIVCGEEGN